MTDNFNMVRRVKGSVVHLPHIDGITNPRDTLEYRQNRASNIIKQRHDQGKPISDTELTEMAREFDRYHPNEDNLKMLCAMRANLKQNSEDSPNNGGNCLSEAAD